MRALVRPVLALLLLAPAAPATAQGVFDLGTLTNPLSAEAVRQSENARAGTVPRAPAGNAAALRFEPSAEARVRHRRRFVEKTRAVDPAGADQLERLFASTDLLAEIGKALVPYGLRTDDVADAYATYWVGAWLASRGRSEDGSKAQAAAVRAQAANAMLATPQLLAATDEQKQELAEAMLIQAVLLDAAVDAAKADPAQLAQVRAAARQGAQAMGLDLDRFELTATGFVPAGPAKR